MKKCIWIIVIIILALFLIYFLGKEYPGSKYCEQDSDCSPKGGCNPTCYSEPPRDAIWAILTGFRICGLPSPTNCACIENECKHSYGEKVLELISISNNSLNLDIYSGNLSFKYHDEPNDALDYSIFVCSESWDWVEINSCYSFDTLEVEKNIESHKYSMTLSGCYVGILEKVDCNS